MNKIKTAAIAATALISLAACGGPGEDTIVPPDDAPAGAAVEEAPEAPPVFHNESEIREHLGLDEDGYVELPDGTRCEAIVVMDNANSVSLYADAGDPVAANPDRTAGVKVGDGDSATCVEVFSALLVDFPDGMGH